MDLLVEIEFFNIHYLKDVFAYKNLIIKCLES